MKMTNILKRFKDQAQAFRVARIAGFFRDMAQAKAARGPKRSHISKKKYVPGSIGVSKVAAEMKKHYGYIPSRRERRQMSVFRPFYNK